MVLREGHGDGEQARAEAAGQHGHAEPEQLPHLAHNAIGGRHGGGWCLCVHKCKVQQLAGKEIINLSARTRRGSKTGADKSRNQRLLCSRFRRDSSCMREASTIYDTSSM